MYKTPYPDAYDQIPLPHKYKLLDFIKFFGQGEVSTVEHVNRFIMQCGEAAQNDVLKRNDESVAAFIQRFRDVKNRCYSLVMSDQQLAEVAFQGLLPHIKDKYASQEFESINQNAARMSGET